MKKIWVEVREGEIIEATAIRSISAGEFLNTDFGEGKNLYIRFVGDRKASQIGFKTVEDKWIGYSRLKAALTGISNPDETPK